jgi:hypothetical protein
VNRLPKQSCERERSHGAFHHELGRLEVGLGGEGPRGGDTRCARSEPHPDGP